MDGFPVDMTVVAHVSIDRARLRGQDGWQNRSIVDIGRRDLNPPHNSFFVGRDMGLVSMNRLLATVPDPARLAVMPDARRSDDRCVNESASSHDDAVLIELPDDLLEQRTVEIILDERLAKANEGGALRRRLACGETAETSKTGTVIERVR